MSIFTPMPPAKLYHCVPAAPEGDCIRTSDGYGMTIPPAVRARLGIAQDGNPPLVFAATHLTKAMAFGLDGRLGEKLLNSSIEGSDNEFVIACDRDRTMSRRRDISIYELPVQDFVVLDHADRQAVSARPVPFAQTRTVMKASSAEDLMRGGLQILTFREAFSELHQSAFMEKTMQARGHKDLYHFMADMLKEGKLHWENADRGIHPDPVLAARLAACGYGAAAPKSKAPKP